jgi:hypothetical protein
MYIAKRAVVDSFMHISFSFTWDIPTIQRLFFIVFISKKSSNVYMSSLEKRAWAELNKLKGLSLDSNSEVKFIIDKTPFNDDGAATSNTNTFIGRILPMASPFNQTALRVEFKLPEKYPAEPPTIRILTPIHHPNVLEDGKSNNK